MSRRGILGGPIEPRLRPQLLLGMEGIVDLELHAGDIVMRKRQRPLHDEGIFAVGIVARTFSERFEVKRPIERLRPFVACANFERACARAQIARIRRHA